MEKDNTPRCLRCNRPLKSEKSIELGYGQDCYKKHKIEKLKGYFKDE